MAQPGTGHVHSTYTTFRRAIHAALIRLDDRISHALSNYPGARARSSCGERSKEEKILNKRGGLSKSVARTPAASAANGKRTAKNTGKYGGD